MWLRAILAVIVGYLLGNLNGAIVVSGFRGDDVRTHGSGNAGLTNFIRNYGVNHALVVVLLDAGKGVVAGLAGGMILKDELGFTAGAAIGGAAVMLGHIFPALFSFRGGKGILTGLAVAIVVDWRIALLIIAVFAAVYFVTRYVSLASVLGSAAFALGFVLWHNGDLVTMLCGIFMGVLAIFMHRQNIVRLIKGTESKTDLFKKK